MDFSDVIRSRRVALGLSQAQLAQRAGVSPRQLARYEAGEQQPVLSAAVTLAEALGISLTQLAGQVSYELDLSGTWWAAWQTWKDGVPRIDTHPLEIHQNGEVLQLDADRAVPVAEGSYRWQGELRLWDNEALIGWYHSTDAAVRSKGTLYLSLQPARRLRLGSLGRDELRRPRRHRTGLDRPHRRTCRPGHQDHLDKDGQ